MITVPKPCQSTSWKCLEGNSVVPKTKFKILKRTPERIHQRNVKENHFPLKKKKKDPWKKNQKQPAKLNAVFSPSVPYRKKWNGLLQKAARFLIGGNTHKHLWVTAAHSFVSKHKRSIWEERTLCSWSLQASRAWKPSIDEIETQGHLWEPL